MNENNGRISRASVDPSLFKKAMENAGYPNANQLQRCFKPGGKTVARIANGDNVKIESLIDVCTMLGVKWQDLVFKEKTGKGNIPFRYSKLLQFAKQIDDKKLQFLKTDPEVNSKWYDKIGQGEHWYHERDILFSREQVNQFFNERIFASKHELLTLADLAQSNLNVDMSKLDQNVTFSGASQNITVERPEVMWPCNCEQYKCIDKLLDAPTLSNEVKRELNNLERQPCPIHNPTFNADEVNDIDTFFAKSLCNIELDNLHVLYQMDVHLWPPTIDVNILIDALKTEIKDNPVLRSDEEKSILDIGAGTGVLGIWLAKNLAEVNSVTYSDWLFHSTLFCYLNHRINFCDENRRQPTANYFLSNLMDDVVNSGQKFSVTICNPPYLPNPQNDPTLYQQSTVTGIDLLKSFIEFAPVVGQKGANYIIFSNIVNDIAQDWAEMKSRQLKPICDWQDVPFRVNHYLNSIPNMIHYLNNGLLTIDNKKALPIRHNLRVFNVLKV